MPNAPIFGGKRADPNARRGGYKARESGESLEAQIEASSRWYSARHSGVLFHCPPKVVGWGNTMRLAGKGAPDYCGVLHGRAVSFDAKSYAMVASYHHPEKVMHQLDRLLEFRAGGGVAAVLVACPVLKVMWRLDDLAALRRGERLPLRSLRGDQVTHHQPYVAESSLVEVATDRAPRWNLATLLLGEVA
jgi:hypothetical protein